MGEEDERREERSRSGRRDPARQMRRDLPVIEGKATEVAPSPGEAVVSEPPQTPTPMANLTPSSVDEAIETSAATVSEPHGTADPFRTEDNVESAPAADRPVEGHMTDAGAERGSVEDTAAERGRPLVPALATIAFLVLVAVVVYLFYQVSNDRSQMADLQSRLIGLEARPAPDIAGIDKRIGTFDTAQSQTRDALASLSKRVDGIQPTPAGNSPELEKVQAQIGELQPAVAAVQSALAGLPKPETERIDARIGEVDQRVSALQSAVSGIPHIDLGPLTSKVDSLESRLKLVEAEVDSAKSPQRVAERQAAPMAVTAQAIVAAIETGQAFPQELKALQVLGADPAKLAPLQTVAANGAPALHDLQVELADLRDRMVAQGVAAPTGSYMDRIMSGASKLVQVRPLGSVVGDTPAAIVARINDDIGGDDLSTALSEWQKLPEASRAVSKGLADRLRLRLEAENAAKSIAANAIGAMAPRG